METIDIQSMRKMIADLNVLREQLASIEQGDVAPAIENNCFIAEAHIEDAVTYLNNALKIMTRKA